MRRILLLITDLQIGGTPTVVRELALRLRRLAYVEVACLAPWGPVADQLREAGVNVTALGARGTGDLRIIPRLAGLIRRGGFDTVYSFLIHANAMAAGMSLAFPSIRYVQSIQTTQPYPRWHWALQRLIHPAAGRIVVPSESVAQAAVEWSGIPRGKIVIIPNAVNPADFAGEQQQWGGGEPFPVGFIGRLDPIKRVPDLLEAVQRLAGRVYLHIFGQGPERCAIEAKIAQLGIADRVTLHGAVARPAEALARMRLLVLPSAAEGFGLVLIEAMAAGVPIVATRAPGIRDVVRDGATGLLVPVGAPSELAAAIERIIDDPALRARLVAQGRDEVRRRFSWEAVIGSYAHVLELPDVQEGRQRPVQSTGSSPPLRS